MKVHLHFSKEKLEASPELAELLDQLTKHCLAPDGSFIFKHVAENSAKAKEEMSRERLRYLEALAIYGETVGLLEESQLALAAPSTSSMYTTSASSTNPTIPEEVCVALEKRLMVAEASQRCQLLAVPQDENSSRQQTQGNGANDETSDGAGNSDRIGGNGTHGTSGGPETPFVGSRSHILGITPDTLRSAHIEGGPFYQDEVGLRAALIPAVEARLWAKCQRTAAAFVQVAGLTSEPVATQAMSLPQIVASAVSELEAERAALLEDHFQANVQFQVYCENVHQYLNQQLMIVRKCKLDLQHNIDKQKIDWLCLRAESCQLKLSQIAGQVLLSTYTEETVPALLTIRRHLVQALENATSVYEASVKKLRQYKGVDVDFDRIAQEFSQIVSELESVQWTISVLKGGTPRGNLHPPNI